MAKRKKSKRIPALLVLAAIIAGFFALLISKIENRVSDCLKIEQNINNVLLTAGVPEKNIISWREEKKKNLVEWLKISKEIRLKKSLWPIFSAKNILGDINSGEKYILVSKDTESGLERRIEILRDGNLYCLVILSDRTEVKAAKLCIVIDDCGGSKKKLIRFTQLNLPLTYAILPYQKYSREIAESLSRSGFDTLLHMPMEPHKADMKALGKGALSVS
ncbi:divergent polysaccharide deacetylase family protein, partial [bacterium]|nr:divergent polysaccharide deacetylase family protein [bacterium]